MNKPTSKMTHEELDELNVPRTRANGSKWTLAERRDYARYNSPKPPRGAAMWKSDQMRELYWAGGEMIDLVTEEDSNEGLCPSCNQPLDGTDLACVNSDCSQYGPRLVWEENDGRPDESQNDTAVWY